MRRFERNDCFLIHTMITNNLLKVVISSTYSFMHRHCIYFPSGLLLINTAISSSLEIVFVFVGGGGEVSNV